MPKRHVTWFVLADGSRARFLTRRAETPGYAVAAEYDRPQARRIAHAMGGDRPGRTQESASAARHAIEPRQDAHRAQKTAFIRDIATRLNDANARDDFDALVLYAAPRSLAILREALDEATRRKIKAEVPSDLTKTPVAELPRHFAEFA